VRCVCPLLLGACFAAIPVVVHAAPPRIVACDGAPLETPGLRDALTLEVGPRQDLDVTVRGPCGDDLVVTISVADTRTSTHLERTVTLARIAPHLRERTIAIVAAQLLDVAQARTQSASNATSDTAGSPVQTALPEATPNGASSTVQADSPATPHGPGPAAPTQTILPEAAPEHAPPTLRLAPPADQPTTPPPGPGPPSPMPSTLRLDARGLARVWLSGPTTFAEGATLGVERGYLRAAVVGAGSSKSTGATSVDFGLATLELSAHTPRLRRGTLLLDAVGYLDGGVAIADASSSDPSIRTRTLTGPSGSAGGRLEAGVDIGWSTDAVLGLEGGYSLGVTATMDSQQIATLAGPFLGVSLGVALGR
jgi:hypothetical protein